LNTRGPVPFVAVLLFSGIVFLVRLASAHPSSFLLFQPDLLAAALFLYVPLIHYRRGKAPAWLRIEHAGRSARTALLIGAGGILAYLLYARLPLPPALAPYSGPAPPLWEILLRQGLLVALPEEVFFRGYLYDAFEERGWEPILPSSVLFAAGHLVISPSWYRALTLFPGLLLGGGRKAAGNVYVPILLHLLFNLLPFFAEGLR
jgi:membrane protease YdiL (CAAX protease family)